MRQPSRGWSSVRRSHYELNKHSRIFCKQRNREIILKAKCRPCADCNIQYNPWVMQFDHRDPLQKRFDLSDGHQHSVKILLIELAKCDVVCANCHAERTQRGQHWAVRREVVDKPNVASDQLDFFTKGPSR